MNRIVGAYCMSILIPVAAGAQAPLWIEAEDAVGTNMANESTLDYGSSAYRLLQLNREGQSASAPFYAEYAVVVPEAGEWSLWLGGTPPGPRSEEIASFVSPLSVIVDDGEPAHLYREDVEVNQKYSTSNYWFTAKRSLSLSAGVHTLRFVVSERRRYDSRYYFSLDAFFLVRAGSPLFSGSADRSGLPPRFPLDLSDRSIDQPYLSIPQYEYSIQNSPKDPDRYLLLAQVYNLIGDHGSAVKILTRGRIVAGDDIRLTLQAAKSRIWSGEIDEGLRLYREYLSSHDADRAVWAEAAKLAAWLMRYRESETLYREAMLRYPDDLNLKVNLALTLLWAGRVKDGEKLLTEAWATARSTPAEIADLAEIYRVSGYNDRAIRSYVDGLELFPDEMGLYFSLAAAYERSNLKDEATQVIAALEKRFVPSVELSGRIEAIRVQASLKERAIAAYRQRLSDRPDDIALRQELVSAFFWNGMLDEALLENGAIIVNRLYGVLVELDGDLAETWRLADAIALVRPAASISATRATAFRDRLKASLAALAKAGAKNDQALRGKDAKRQAQAAQELADAQAGLAAELSDAERFLSWAEALAARSGALTKAAEAEAGAAEADEALVRKLSPWSWNPAEELAALRIPAQANPLAWHALARIASIEGRRPAAPAGLDLTEASARLASQLAVWASGSLDPEAFDAASYYGHGSELLDTAALSAVPASEGVEAAAPPAYREGLDLLAADTIGELESMGARGAESSSLLQAAHASLFSRARARLRVRMYQFDSESMQDRRQQADVYLSLGRPADAVSALARVLRVSDSDIASRFTLARALEMSGDWKGAMGDYRAVYELNPRYENAASSYNRQALLHATLVEAVLDSSLDSLESGRSAVFSVKAPLLSSAGLELTHEAASKKLHAPPSGLFPESVALHTTEARLPVTVAGLGLRLYGLAGFTLQNKLENLLPPTLAEAGLDAAGDFAAVAPRAGAGLSWERGPFIAGADYRFDQLESTFYQGRTAYYQHAGRIRVSAFKEAPTRSFARTVSGGAYLDLARVGAPSRPLEEPNLLLTVNAEGRLGSALGPLVTLELGAQATWRDSSRAAADDYYAPIGVLSLKGGPAISVRSEGGSGWRPAATARIWPGFYSADGEGRPSLEGQAVFELSGRGASLFVSASGSWTAATASSAAYWSASAGLGSRIALADYIIP